MVLALIPYELFQMFQPQLGSFIYINHGKGDPSHKQQRHFAPPWLSFDPSEVGIYKRKQESKIKDRKHALDQESGQENDKEKKRVFRLKNINQFQFQPLLVKFIDFKSFVDSIKLKMRLNV